MDNSTPKAPKEIINGTTGTIGIKELILKAITDKNKQIVEPIFLSIIVVGFIIKFAFGFSVASTDGSTGPASSLIWGYSVIIFGLIGIIYSNLNQGVNEYESIKRLPYPIILSIVLMVWLITLNINYFKKINSLSVPEQYFSWSNYSSILLVFLLGVSLIQYILIKSKSPEEKTKNLSLYAYVLLFFNLIAIMIQQVILNSFTVDG
jgi:hypothetical protein